MAPKTKYTLENIISVAFDLVRKKGLDKLTARAIARQLNSSTMPIYSSVKNMSVIEEEVIRLAWNLLFDYQQKKRADDPYLDIGLGYVIFAKEEPELFKCIQSQKFFDLNKKFYGETLAQHLKRLKNHPAFQNVSDETKLKIMIQGWIFSHGFADLLTKQLTASIPGTDTEDGIIKFFIESNYLNWIGMDHYVKVMSEKE